MGVANPIKKINLTESNRHQHDADHRGPALGDKNYGRLQEITHKTCPRKTSDKKKLEPKPR